MADGHSNNHVGNSYSQLLTCYGQHLGEHGAFEHLNDSISRAAVVGLEYFSILVSDGEAVPGKWQRC